MIFGFYHYAEVTGVFSLDVQHELFIDVTSYRSEDITSYLPDVFSLNFAVLL